jgi:hypothetical protein
VNILSKTFGIPEGIIFKCSKPENVMCQSKPNRNPPYQSFIRILSQALKDGSLVILGTSRETFSDPTFFG